ncbi:unnamed protein product [Protopolystoma xenopodis]|uniref:Uncharacterized protein n=1 Tax=Protopolystoma xenopodis TaxID=117903 RepID=A0A3S5FD40_9PLAT|nr:unnamed protein product [Protopolystoma xenopodis]
MDRLKTNRSALSRLQIDDNHVESIEKGSDMERATMQSAKALGTQNKRFGRLFGFDSECNLTEMTRPNPAWLVPLKPSDTEPISTDELITKSVKFSEKFKIHLRMTLNMRF